MKNLFKIDLKSSCELFSHSIRKTLHDLIAIKMDEKLNTQKVKSLHDQQDLFFSILFTGQIYGEFLIGIEKKQALKILLTLFKKIIPLCLYNFVDCIYLYLKEP